MKKSKVFISSIIDRYLDRRDAAEEAIRELNRDGNFSLETIRIEPNTHPAVNKSSQKTCLDGVKECDIYLGIYPRYNYGKKSSVGISPTHEEFRCAVKYNKRRLVFIEDSEKEDSEQKEFLKEVGEYVKGRFWNEFKEKNIDQLKHLVYRSLSELMKPRFEDLSPVYLNAILQKYKQIVGPWDEDSGSLSANKIVQLRLIFGKQNDEYTTDRDKIEFSTKESNNLSFSEAIEKNQALLIIGSPGSGKSTSLKWIAYTYANKIINFSQKSLPIPIYLALINYTNTLFDLIITCLRENGVNCDEETIKEYIKLGKFLFIIDGFDELEKRDVHKCFNEIRSLMAFSGDNKIVVASRKMEYIKELQTLTPHVVGNKFNPSLLSKSLTFFGTSEIRVRSPILT